MKENSFSYEKLIECGKGMLFGEGNAQLPLPPMLIKMILLCRDVLV